jgi:hypothetical protein
LAAINVKIGHIDRKGGHCKQNEHRHGDYQNCLATFAMSEILESVFDHDHGQQL